MKAQNWSGKPAKPIGLSDFDPVTDSIQSFHSFKFCTDFLGYADFSHPGPNRTELGLPTDLTSQIPSSTLNND
jgi:hypothetical protein